MVYLWKNAVEKAGTFEDLDKVRTAMIGTTFAAPQGEIKMFPNHHTSERVMIGEAQADGQFKIISDSKTAIPPIPWNQFVPETKGYTCDWTQNRPDAGKFKM
jgi:urea transport system substrate-binding protein